jgi:hypothetical protein
MEANILMRSKRVARIVGMAWVKSMLRDYVEPTAQRVPKGETKGFSLARRQAALFQILFPRCLGLKEIGKVVGTSPGVVGVWRKPATKLLHPSGKP